MRGAEIHRRRLSSERTVTETSELQSRTFTSTRNESTNGPQIDRRRQSQRANEQASKHCWLPNDDYEERQTPAVYRAHATARTMCVCVCVAAADAWLLARARLCWQALRRTKSMLRPTWRTSVCGGALVSCTNAACSAVDFAPRSTIRSPAPSPAPFPAQKPHSQIKTAAVDNLPVAETGLLGGQDSSWIWRGAVPPNSSNSIIWLLCTPIIESQSCLCFWL